MGLPASVMIDSCRASMMPSRRKATSASLSARMRWAVALSVVLVQWFLAFAAGVIPRNVPRSAGPPFENAAAAVATIRHDACSFLRRGRPPRVRFSVRSTRRRGQRFTWFDSTKSVKGPLKTAPPVASGRAACVRASR